ncbi:MAG: hypothetical protein K0Q49_1292 [Haloplasmataceae bacterium]|jgi:hypothetical protein|nr:hypothetical protein [Haloplasmataceae bacterium]
MLGVDFMISIGDNFGYLTVIADAGMKRISNLSKYDSPHFLCQCGCGNQIEVSEPSLHYNIVKSCGCNKNRRTFSIKETKPAPVIVPVPVQVQA